MLAKAETRERRQKRLEHFFREAYALTFGLKPGEKRRREDEGGEVVMRTSLSRAEFASALGMKPDAVFEFLDTVVLFSRGKTEDKLRIIFDMCDNDKNGVIDKGELSEMLRSLVEIARTTSLSDAHVTELIDGMFQVKYYSLATDKRASKIRTLLRRESARDAMQQMTSFHIDAFHEEDKSWFSRQIDCWTTFLEENRQNIFYLFIFYVITIALFVERFIHYSFLAEHTDLRHIMGVGIAITRGSAASLSFCYCLLLLTMSRNLLTKLKEFSIQQYVPLDAHIQFHKIAACTALFFSLLHSVGHIVNFYHLSQQPLEHLHCLTSEVHFPSDYRPTITFWLFQTITD
ncbi:hypothetical protein LSTR_LSTR012442 [Laodelphax striatellus]|uniref:EF-hand domain-containing protein n=1 Tax=Laodelphax striatellus TaxID=195883 RepID=A0A482X3S9_LAOST|nr:hypothetical protein LSTR_LSTR012442 [Laodelphax striatellus]